MGLFSSKKRRIGVAADSSFDLDQFVAAAVDVRSADGKVYRSQLPAWQRQSLEFYDLVGEAWFPAQFYARMLSRVRLYPGVRQPNGEVKESNDKQAQEILSRVKDADGGPSQWMAQYGRLQFLIGDGYLAVTLDDDGREQWEYLSPAELVPNGDGTYTRKGGNGTQERTLREVSDVDALSKDSIRAWRLWRKHPTHSELADAPLRGVIGLLRVLMLLDKAQEAQAVSRIVASGLLVVDDRITIPVADSDAAEENMDEDPFMSLLTKYIVAPIGDPGSAAQMAPLVARVEVPEGAKAEDLVQLIQLHDPNQTADWQQRIEKVVTRIAVGLDMPPEEFLGLAQANHWTGWVITEEKWKAHGEPVTIALCEDLTAAYFRRACIDANVANAENLVVWYDAAQVVVHPDRGKDAIAVHQEGELSGDSLRKYNNFSKDDKPSAEERAFYEATKLKTAERPKDPSEADSSDSGSDAPRDAPGNNGKRTDQPSPQPGGQDMTAVLWVAAMMAVERCRELAGSRLGAKRMSAPEAFRGTENVEKAELAATLGKDVVRMLDITSDLALVKGATEPFVKAVMAVGIREERARELAKQIEVDAAATLYDRQTFISSELHEELSAAV